MCLWAVMGGWAVWAGMWPRVSRDMGMGRAGDVGRAATRGKGLFAAELEGLFWKRRTRLFRARRMQLMKLFIVGRAIPSQGNGRRGREG